MHLGVPESHIRELWPFRVRRKMKHHLCGAYPAWRGCATSTEASLGSDHSFITKLLLDLIVRVSGGDVLV